MTTPERQDTLNMLDAHTLRKAARIMRTRSTRQGFWLEVFCKVLTKTADRIQFGP